MKRLTIRVPEDLAETIDERATAADVSDSEAARQLLRRGTEYDDLQTENERLRNEKRGIIEQRTENKDLRRYVENDIEWHEADLLTRVRWFVFGKK